VIAYFIDCYIW